jgi:hypothetical protein
MFHSDILKNLPMTASGSIAELLLLALDQNKTDRLVKNDLREF